MPSKVMEDRISNTAADKAGAMLRDYFVGNPRGVSDDDVVDAYFTVSLYRDMHAYPMTKVTNGVRHYIKAATGDESLRPGQRFKRMNRILDKLRRYPHMRLSQMEDIGGCRAVLNNRDQVNEVVKRITRRWTDARVIDYVENPKSSGYRSVHLIARRDGRMVEVQLRTTGQHAWADAAETWTPPAVDFNVKDDPAGVPEPVRSYFQVAGEIIALRETGQQPEEALMTEVRRLEGELAPYQTELE